jgi:hypothetical protein
MVKVRQSSRQLCLFLACLCLATLFHPISVSFLHDSMQMTESTAPLMIFSPDSGLGNNMIALVSSKFLAGILQSPFAIVWERDSTLSCQAAYTDIFTDSGHNLPELRMREICPRLCDLDLTHFGSKECWNMINCDSEDRLADNFKDCSCVRIRSNQYFLEPLARRFAQTKPFSFYAGELFQPAASLAEQVMRTRESWKSEFNISHVIGVHVRSVFYTAGISDGHLIPQDGVFKKYFWPCVHSISLDLKGERVGIFVAADTAKVRNEATEMIRSSNDVVMLPSPISDIPNDTGIGPMRNKQEVLDAATELFLLQTSDSIVVKRVGRFDSTFSAVAVALSLCESRGACYIVGEHNCERTTEPVSPDLHHTVESNCDEPNLVDVDRDCLPKT